MTCSTVRYLKLYNTGVVTFGVTGILALVITKIA